MEGTTDILDGNYRERKQAVDKCAKVARNRGFLVFGVRDGGQCFSNKQAERNYENHGTIDDCTNGEGGPLGFDVYQLGSSKIFLTKQ